MTNISEVKFAPRNQDALQLAEALVDYVKTNENATELFALVKIGTDYHRFSTNMKDMMSLVSILELSKFDCLKRMNE
jgi:hypothetical protein